MGEKKYIKGSAKAIQTQYGDIIKIQVNPQWLLDNCTLNKNGYVTIDITKKRDTDQFGNTHSMVENNYQKQ